MSAVCSICLASQEGQKRPASRMVCAVCLRNELCPLRRKLEHSRVVIPRLRDRFAATYEKSESRGETRRACLEVAAECDRLEKSLADVAKRAQAWRAKAATARRIVEERRIALDKAEAALATRKAQFSSVERCVRRGGGGGEIIETNPASEEAKNLTVGTPKTGGLPPFYNRGEMPDKERHRRVRQEVSEGAWRRASEIFALFPIKQTSGPPRRGSLRGVMTIVGLPLPNVGSAVLASALPRNVCASALAAVALLTSVVARVLGVTLPHPLIPRLGTDAYAAVTDRAGTASARRHSFDESFADEDSGRPTSWSAGAFRRGKVPAPGSSVGASQGRATSFLASSPRNGPQRYALAPAVGASNDNFVVALNLLQNDLTHLCVKAGLDPQDLWPAEALLLNLAELRDAATRRVREADLMTSSTDLLTSSTLTEEDEHEREKAPPLAQYATTTTPIDVPRLENQDRDLPHDDDLPEDDKDPHRRLTQQFHERDQHDDSTSSLATDDNDDWIFLGSLPFLGLSSHNGD